MGTCYSKMSLLPHQTNINMDTYFFLTGNGKLLNISTLNAGNISTGSITAGEVSSIQVDAEYINTSTINTLHIDLDGQILTASPTELLLNGIPVATQSSLSTIADWSLDPAISTVQMAGNNINEAGMISTNSIVGGSAFFGQLMAINSMFLSTYTSTISTQINVADAGFYSTISTGYLTGGDVSPSSIWGQPSSFYQTAASTINSGNIICSTLTANDSISTPSLLVSSINGSEFNSTGIVVQVAGVSSLVANSISSIGAELRTALVSTLQFNPSFSPNLDINLGLGSLFPNLAGAAAGGLGVLVGAAGLGTGIAALAQGRQTNYINSNVYETVNGTTQLQVSTLGAATSTIFRANSGVPANVVPGAEVFISSILPPGTTAIRSVSDPLNTVSTPNSTIQAFGEWVALPEIPIASTLSTFNQLFTSSLTTSTIGFNNNTLFRAGSSFGATGGVSTLELYWAGSVPPLDADLRVGALVISGNDVGGLNYSKDVLIQNQTSGNRLQVFGAGGVGPSTIAFLSDIPAPQPLVSSFSTIYMGANGDINILEGGSIQLGAAGGANGSLNAGVNPSLILDGPTSEVAVPAVFTDRLGGKNVTQIDVDPNTVLSASTSALYISSINNGIPYTTANPPPVADTSTILVSSIGSIGGVSSINIVPNALANWNIDTVGRFTEIGRSFNLQAQSTSVLLGELLVDSASGGGNGLFRLAAGVGNINASTINMSTSQLRVPNISTNTLGVGSISFNTGTLSSLMSISTAFIPGTGTSTTTYLNTDMSLGQNDFYCGQLRVGALSTAVQAEVIIYQPDGGTKALNVQDGDRTLRIGSSALGGVLASPGYILDTFVNPPFFSTINAGTSTALFAYYPSTVNSTIGASTLSVIPNPIFVAAGNSLSSQKVVAANTPLALDLGSLGINVGGYTLAASTLTVPVAGTYQFTPSLQFNTTSGGANQVDFWMTKNGADLPNSASRVSVANNAEQIGTVVIYDTAAANDKYGIKIASADNNMSAGFFQSTVTTPYTRPAIPSVILNAQRVA